MQVFRRYRRGITISLNNGFRQNLLLFLTDNNLLKTKFENKCYLGKYSCDIRSRCIKLLPFFILALKTKEINTIFSSPVKSLKALKSRAKNYYCEDLIKKLVSIFGNEKAWDEFDVSSKWKPKFKYVKFNYYFLPCTSLIRCCCYNSCTAFTWNNSQQQKIGTDLDRYFSDIEIAIIRTSFLRFYSGRTSSRSKRKISMILNGSANSKSNNTTSELLKTFDTIKQLLGEDIISEDGIKLHKDLNVLTMMK